MRAIILLLLTFVTVGNVIAQKPGRERRWTGTVTFVETTTVSNQVYTSSGQRQVTASFHNALPTLYRDDPTPDLNFTDDKGAGTHVFHEEGKFIASPRCVTDCSSSDKPELHAVVIREWDNTYDIEVVTSTCVGTTACENATREYTESRSITISNHPLGPNKNVLSGSITRSGIVEPAYMGTTVTNTTTWYLTTSDDIDEPCTACGSVIGIENQSLGQAITITGTPFSLHYRSNRMPGGSMDIGAWTFNVHHTLLGQRLEFGDGQHRTFGNDADAIKPVTNEIPGIVPAGGYLVAGEDGSEVYAFDRNGQHLRTHDALTGTLIYEFRYNEKNQLTSIVDTYGSATTIERNENGLPVCVVNAYGQRSDLLLDNKQNLVSITNGAGEKNSFTYSDGGLLTSMVNPRGFTHTYDYDAAGKLVKDSDPSGGFTNLASTSITNGHEVAVSTKLGRSAKYRLYTQPDGIRRSVITFPDGSRNSQTTWIGGRRKVEFGDGTIRINDKAPDPRHGEQSPTTQTTTIETPGGLKAKKTHERLIKLSDPFNPLSLTKLTDSWSFNGRISTSEYITSSRTLTEKSPGGRTITTMFDNNGKVSKILIPEIAPVIFTYDAQGRLLKVEQGADEEFRLYEYKYNNRGNIASIADPMMRSSTFEYDAADRTTLANLPGDRVISYRYDEAGNVTTIIPPGKPKHTFEYNTVNLVTKYNPPDSSSNLASTSFEYNADHQLSRIIRPDGQIMKMSYDPGGCACGKLNEAIQPRGTNSFEYYPKTGRLKTITAPGGVSLTFAYDGALLKTESWKGPVMGTVTRNYNAQFEIVSDKVSGGPLIEYKYDADGLLVQAGEEFITHSPSNTLIKATKLGPINEIFTHNIFGELMKAKVEFNNLPLLDVQYTRDKLGRIIRRSESIEGVATNYEYAYDLAGRLETVIRNGDSKTSLKYDLNYNRVRHESAAGNISASYDNQDRLIEYGMYKFTYTTAGELLTKTTGSAVTYYEYDLLGNLIKIKLPNQSVIDYIIDGRSRRIGRKVNGILVQGYLYQDGLLISAALDAKGNVVSRFVYGSRTNIPDYMIKGGVVYRIIADHLGSPRLIVDTKTGKVVQRIDYDELGNILIDTNPGFQPFGFAGGLYDSDTKLTRFGLRDYDAETGRWTSKDPLLFQGEDTNPYSYVKSDPINARDAVGLQSSGSAGVSNFGLSLAVPLVEGAFREMAFQAAMAGFKVTGKNEKSGHNVGSKHYKGNAIDVRCWDKSDKEIEDFIDFMRSQGYTVKDERVRPPGQKVWSGPHLHIEVPTPKPPPKPNPRPQPIQSGVCGPPR